MTQQATQIAEVQERKPVFVLRSGDALHLLLVHLSERATKERNETHSVEYWAEDLLADAIERKNAYFTADRARRNNAQYLAEESKLDPTASDFIARLVALRRKYGIGGTQQEVK